MVPNEEDSSEQIQEEQVQVQPHVITNLNSPKTYSPIIGVAIIVLFAILLIACLVLRRFISWRPFVLFEAFYRMGSIIFGGGQVVLPMIMIEFTEMNPYMTRAQFMNGFAIVSALPGPMFNISIYLGAIMNGVSGGIICWLGMFLPAFMFIWAVLPFWNKYREKVIVKQLLTGVNAVSIGFVYAAIYMLWLSNVDGLTGLQVSFAAITVAIDFCVLHILNVPAPAVVIFSGLFRMILFYIGKA